MGTGCDTVIAAGGDGTVNEVANGLLHANSNTTLGISSVWEWQRYCSQHRFSKQAAGRRDPLQHVVRRDTCDVAQVDIQTASGDMHRYFLNNAGFGFEAYVNVCSKNIRYLRKLPLYLAAALKAAVSYEPVPMSVSWTNDEDKECSWSGDITMISVANGARTGGGFRILPHAILNDRWLDVGIVPAVSKTRILTLLVQVMRRTHVHAKEPIFSRFRRFTATTEQVFPMHVDGEVLTEHAEQATVSLLTRTLEILAPRKVAQ